MCCPLGVLTLVIYALIQLKGKGGHNTWECPSPMDINDMAKVHAVDLQDERKGSQVNEVGPAGDHSETNEEAEDSPTWDATHPSPSMIKVCPNSAEAMAPVVNGHATVTDKSGTTTEFQSDSSLTSKAADEDGGWQEAGPRGRNSTGLSRRYGQRRPALSKLATNVVNNGPRHAQEPARSRGNSSTGSAKRKSVPYQATNSFTSPRAVTDSNITAAKRLPKSSSINTRPASPLAPLKNAAQSSSGGEKLLPSAETEVLASVSIETNETVEEISGPEKLTSSTVKESQPATVQAFSKAFPPPKVVPSYKEVALAPPGKCNISRPVIVRLPSDRIEKEMALKMANQDKSLKESQQRQEKGENTHGNISEGTEISEIETSCISQQKNNDTNEKAKGVTFGKETEPKPEEDTVKEDSATPLLQVEDTGNKSKTSRLPDEALDVSLAISQGQNAAETNSTDEVSNENAKVGASAADAATKLSASAKPYRPAQRFNSEQGMSTVAVTSAKEVRANSASSHLFHSPPSHINSRALLPIRKPPRLSGATNNNSWYSPASQYSRPARHQYRSSFEKVSGNGIQPKSPSLMSPDAILYSPGKSMNPNAAEFIPGKMWQSNILQFREASMDPALALNRGAGSEGHGIKILQSSAKYGNEKSSLQTSNLSSNSESTSSKLWGDVASESETELEFGEKRKASLNSNASSVLNQDVKILPRPPVRILAKGTSEFEIKGSTHQDCTPDANGHASSEATEASSSDHAATDNGNIRKGTQANGDGFTLVTKRRQRSRNQPLRYIRGNGNVQTYYRQKGANGNPQLFRSMYRVVGQRKDVVSSNENTPAGGQPQVVSVR